MQSILIALACIFTLIRPVISQAQRPLPLTWSSTTFGPDGPWQAVSVVVGTDKGSSPISLYPGGTFDSNILVTDYCNGTISGCPAAAAGLYNVAYSPTADFRSIQAPAIVVGWHANEPMNITGQGVYTLDTMRVGSFSTTFNISQAVFSSVVSSNIAMPNGSSYPVSVGNLALGGPNLVQTFLIGDGSQNVTGQVLTGYLRKNNDITSSSFGLHIGSANLGQVGSLILGGYDQARISGPVATYDAVGGAGDPIADLIDINIGVQTGGTPFNTTKIPSLYSNPKGPTTSVLLNPLVPYLSLPPATCAAIASWLPVTYRPSIGLYTWNQNDWRYQAIISSPSYLSFTFRQINNGNLTVKVPFSLLNLTLQSPIVATPTQYFPCHPWTSPSGLQHLGRAFMQAAYLGMNWEQTKFFLAQATGPGMGPSSIQTINPSDTTIQGGDAGSFEDSWSSLWTVLPANKTSAGSTPDTSSSSNSNDGGGGLNAGTKIGIGVGAGVGVLSIITLVVFLLSRRRRKRREREAVEAAQLQQREMEQQQAAAAAAAAAASASARHVQSYGYQNEKAYPFGGPPPDHRHPYHSSYPHAQYRHELAVPPGELDAPRAIHEAPQTQRTFHEAPADDVAHELPSTPIMKPLPNPPAINTNLVKQVPQTPTRLQQYSGPLTSHSFAASSTLASLPNSPSDSQSYDPVSALTREGTQNERRKNVFSDAYAAAISPASPSSATARSSSLSTIAARSPQSMRSPTQSMRSPAHSTRSPTQSMRSPTPQANARSPTSPSSRGSAMSPTSPTSPPSRTSHSGSSPMSAVSPETPVSRFRNYGDRI